jgi:hypothetical protein
MNEKDETDEIWEMTAKICHLGDATAETKGFDFTGRMDQIVDRRN